ncbi:hypothetical protein B296_00049345 [Ensete ventricosum]|uniref:Uncharacterized protein n=1 Tax=Ensete ventricosum TaxID=4639 RepID=A0A426XIZ9_ENSVE|nr:hypothetical protein B296_00049345 [Ensete ventricosum]
MAAYTVAEVLARLGPMECVRLPTLLLVDKWGLAGKLVVGSSGRLFEMWHMIGSSSWMVASGGKLITSSVPLRLNSRLNRCARVHLYKPCPILLRGTFAPRPSFGYFESPYFPSESSGTPLSYRIELNLVHRYGILNKVHRIKAYCSVRTVCTISIGKWDRRYIGMPHYTVKAPYRSVCTGPVVDRYVDRPLSGGTAKRRSIEGKIDRRRSISAVGDRLRRNREGKKKKKRKRKKEK